MTIRACLSRAQTGRRAFPARPVSRGMAHRAHLASARLATFASRSARAELSPPPVRHLGAVPRAARHPGGRLPPQAWRLARPDDDRRDRATPSPSSSSSPRLDHHPASPARGFAASGASSARDASAPATTSPRASSSSSSTEKLVLYRGPWLLPFRALVRFKVFQLAGLGAATVPLAAALNDEALGVTTLGACAGVVLGTAACSFALQYYASRYIGELSLVRAANSAATDRPARVRLSTMTFWGARVDADVVQADILPPLRDVPREALVEMAAQMFVPLDVVGSKQHILSLRYGEIRDGERLFALLRGEKVGFPSAAEDSELSKEERRDGRDEGGGRGRDDGGGEGRRVASRSRRR